MDKRGNVEITRKPKLRNPNMVCGISGWDEVFKPVAFLLKNDLNHLWTGKNGENYSQYDFQKDLVT